MSAIEFFRLRPVAFQVCSRNEAEELVTHLLGSDPERLIWADPYRPGLLLFRQCGFLYMAVMGPQDYTCSLVFKYHSADSPCG